MSNWFELELDTTPPSSPTLQIENDATFVSTLLVDLTLGTGDPVTTGYQMKIWGDVDPTFNSNIQPLEGDSSWMTFNSLQQIQLLDGDGNKAVHYMIRDDVHNESSQVTKSVYLDTTLPTVQVTGPDVPKISKMPGANVASFSFTVSEPFEEYKVCVVNSSGVTEDGGVTIGTANGSTNTSGNAGGYDTSSSPIVGTITGSDFEAAKSGDEIKVVKIFVKDQSGKWSA